MKPASLSMTKPCRRLVLTALAGACGVFAQPGAFTQYAYVSNHAGGVSVVNGTTGTVVGSPIPLTGPLTGLTLAGGQLYVAQSGANSVTVVDAASNDLLATIPVGSAPLRLAATPTGQTVYVVNNGSDTVSAISTASNTVTATIPVGTGPTSLAVTPDGSRVFVANRTSGTVSVISTASNTVTATWTFAAGANGVVLSPDGGTLYVSNIDTSTIKVCSAISGSPIATIGGLRYPDSMAITPNGNYLYVSNRNAASVSVISTASRDIAAVVSVGATPISVVISWDGSKAYVANYNGNSLSVISTATKSVVRTVTATMANPYSVVVTNLCYPAPAGLPALSVSSVSGEQLVPSASLPGLPQGCYAPTYPPTYPPPASTITVTTAAGLQAALNGAVCGQKIVVTAGTTYDSTGFTVPALPQPCGTNPVLVVSSAIASLPQYTVPPQSLAGSASVPTISCNTTGCATLSISDNASGWYFAGLEFTVDASVTGVYPVVTMGDYTATVGALPQYITFDRCLIHPSSATNPNDASRGLDLNAVYSTLMFSNVWGFVSNTKDTQSLLIYNTTGPDLVTSNHLEASGENVAIFTVCASGSYGGQGIPTCPPPSDITLTRNHLLKLLSWQNAPSGCPGSGPCYEVKNALECKSCQRVMVDSNWFDTTFAQGQDEFTIVNCIFAGVFYCNDLTYTNNLFEHGPTVGAFAGHTTASAGTMSNSGLSTSITFSNSGDCSSILGAGTTVVGSLGPSFNIVSMSCPTATISPATNVLTAQTFTWTTTGQRMLFRNNLAIDVSSLTWGGGYGWTWAFQNSANTTLDHNTMVNTPVNGAGFYLGDPPPSTDTVFQWTNNFNYGSPNAAGDYPGQAIAGLPSPVFGGAVFVGDWWPCIFYPSCAGAPGDFYPAGISTVDSTVTPNPPNTSACNVANKPIVQCWPLDWALVGFLDFTGGNAGTDLPGMALAATSPYHNAATDGTDIGANVPAVLAAIKGVQ